ncbi:MAG TPA: ABC transporter permease [Candidatus Omnitrophota bacterium]|nr:ABC transporter permease [Candidatus Omnitrophota bacterium]
MSPNRIIAIVLRQIYLIRGSFSRVFPTFAWIAVDMVLWGFLTRYLNKATSGGPDFVPILLGAVLLWDFFIRIMQGVTMAFFEDVWSRNFLNVFATPILISEYVGGLILSSIVTSAIGLAVMLCIAAVFFHLSLLVYGIMTIPFLAVLFLFGIALGIFACAVVLRFGPASEWFIWPLPALISPFAGVLYPISTLPEWMRYISVIFPPSYVFEGLRAMVSGSAVQTAALVKGGLLAVAYIVAAYYILNRVYRHALRTGLIARYSAETIS